MTKTVKKLMIREFKFLLYYLLFGVFVGFIAAMSKPSVHLAGKTAVTTTISDANLTRLYVMGAVAGIVTFILTIVSGFIRFIRWAIRTLKEK